ncbi:S-layer homology domain-containing protein [Lawsonibacter sp. LCP25S3_F5]
MSLDYIGASATMILSGHNYFAGGRDKAGIMVHENASLTIQGDGSVTAKGGAGFYGGAGIGGEGDKRCGRIIINGGSDAPAIGSGSGASSSGSLTGSGDAWVTASKFGTDTSGFNGFLNGAVSGSVQLTQSRSLLDLTIPSGTSLTIPSGMKLTVTGTLKIDGFAVIDGDLTVIDAGALEQCDPTQYAPVLDSRTSDTITLKPSTGARYGYSTDGSVPTTWQDNPVFTGLSESTQYTFFIFYESATQFYQAGTSQGLQVHTLPHLIDTWKAIDADQHRGHCFLCGDAQLVEPHDFSANATHVPGTADELPYDAYSCSVCGYEKRVYDTSAAMTLKLRDSDSDGWNGARLLLYRNGQFWQRINMTDGSTKTVSLPYADDIVYSFRWEKGNYDSEVGLTVTLPGQSTPTYEKSDFSSVEDGELLLRLNAGDYTAVQNAIAAIPADLSIYAPASVQPLLDVVDAVNWELPPSRQEEIDGFAPDIMNRIAALEADPDGEAEGRFHLSAAAEDLYITATGWRWGEQGTETPYTGAYRLGGTSTHRVIVESGAVNISIFELNLTHATDAPFVIDSGASVDLTLLGRNTLKHTDNDYGPAALNVPTGATLTITRESIGSLLAYSAEDGAGIGGNDGQGSGPITINGGTITAISDDDGAGIGSGRKGNSGTITINGGTITAISEDDGAGIGSGYDRTSGPITINGGTITAISEDDGDGIGAGDSGTPSSITISGGTIIAKSEHESAMSVAPDLSALTTYRWRSAESDPYTVGNLVWAKDAGYLEIVQTLSVSFDPNGGSGTMDPVTVDYGATYLFPENGFTAPEGIVSGVSPTRFGPDLPCTRAQAMTFLYGAMGSPAVTGGSGFLDVDSGAYYAGPVAWAVKNHITSGTGNGLFGTENICTRAQIVTFLFGLYEK